MNQKEINFKQNLLFSLILISGVAYSCLLLTLVKQTHSGFIMQLIFLAEYLKNQPLKIYELVSSPSFVLNSTSGLLVLFLVAKWLHALYLAVSRLISTQKHIQRLSAVFDKRGFYIINNLDPIAFTAGLFRPKIFLSQGVLKNHTKREINAIIFHEKKHQLSLDPAKNLIMEFIKNSLPIFPKKDWFFAYYQTISEVSCDYYSQNSTSDKTSLVSALSKLYGTAGFLNPASYFSSQSERIHILVGKRNLTTAPLLTLNSILLAILLIGHLYLSNNNPFYICNHLIDCAKVLLSPKPQLPDLSAPVSVSQHCSNL